MSRHICAALLVCLYPWLACASDSAPAGAPFNLSELAATEALQAKTSRTSAVLARARIHPPRLPQPPYIPTATRAIPAPPTLRSPAPTANFEALGDNNIDTPPDTDGAVGPSHLVVALNSGVRVQTRQGAELALVSLEGFFGGIKAFDPKVTYDALAGRWVLVAMSDDKLPTSALNVAVSASSDPTGTWYRFQFDVDPKDKKWGDFPGLGYNKNWIVVTFKLFAISSDTIFGSAVYAFDKADLYANGGADGKANFTLLNVPEPSDTLVPATTYDPSLESLFLIETLRGVSGALRLSAISGPVGSETIQIGVGTPTAPVGWGSFAPVEDFSPQMGSNTRITTGDDRMLGCVFRNGSIWCTHTVLLPAAAPTRASVQWWQIDTTGTVQQRGLIDDPSGQTFYDYPSIAVNKNNDVLIGYSRFSPTQFPSANYSFRAGNDAPNTLQSDTVFKAGDAVYDKFRTENRWGDYSSTHVDPVNDSDLWTIQEYAAPKAAGIAQWGTWWSLVTAPASAPRLPTITSGLAANAIFGVPFVYSIATDGTPPITFGASALPPGLTFNGATISGTPTTLGSFTVTLNTSNAAGSDSKTLVLNVINAVLPGSTGMGFARKPAGSIVDSSSIKKKFTLKFNTTGKDSIDFTLANADFVFTDSTAFAQAVVGRKLNVYVDRTNIDTLTLFDRGLGIGFGKSTWDTRKGRIRYTLKNESLQAFLEPFGAVDSTVLRSPITIPLFFEIEGVRYGGNIPFLYTAQDGKTGSGK